MKKNYFFLAALVAAGTMMSFTHLSTNKIEKIKKFHLNTGGAGTGRTGAPGEGNCTQCHNGTVQSGTGFNLVTFADNNGLVTSYTPGQTYHVVVSMTTNNAKNGFQIVALNSSDAQAGSITITDATNTQVNTGAAGKKYVNHKSAGTAFSTWTFDWTAPATNVGDVTFYLATNQTNNQSNDSGDIIRVSQHVIGSTASINENEAKTSIQLGYVAATNSLKIDLSTLSNGEAFLNLVNTAGQSVFTENLGMVNVGENNLAVKLNNELPKGMYIANVSVNNNFVSKKIMIQ